MPRLIELIENDRGLQGDLDQLKAIAPAVGVTIAGRQRPDPHRRRTAAAPGRARFGASPRPC
jgi:hypothetical protein